ncbi:MAG: hypothetical protein KAI83_10180, partial [Thiomargarita sp.]|nr:hypothetical protein [Thiomargarita sp.]
ESKDILISFLNAVVDFDGNPIVDLTIINPYQIPLGEGLTEPHILLAEIQKARQQAINPVSINVLWDNLVEFAISTILMLSLERRNS